MSKSNQNNEKKAQETELNPQFVELAISRDNNFLAKLYRVAKEWYQLTGVAEPEFTTIVKKPKEVEVSEGDEVSEDEPREFIAYDNITLTTKGLHETELDALNKGYAHAQTKEKALAYVSGFLKAITLFVI